MKRRLALALPFLASAALAQYTGEPPSLVNQALAYPALRPGVVSAIFIYQVRMVPHPSLPADTFYCCLTVGTASAQWALQTGTFNTATGLYVRNSDIDGVNGAFGTTELFALTVSSDLLTAAFDTAAGVRYATRSTLTAPFTLQPGIVTGLSGTYVDPSFGRVNGQEVLFQVPRPMGGIEYGIWSPGAVTNNKLIAVGATLHSPTPFNDSLGNSRGAMFVDAGPSWAGPYQLYYTSLVDLDAGTPARLVYSSPSYWIENGDASGGTITIVTDGFSAGYTVPLQMGISAVDSSNLPAAAPSLLQITSFGPLQAPPASPYLGVTMLGTLAPSGIPIGGIVNGNLSLSTVAFLPLGTFSNAGGTYEQTYPVPGLPLGTKLYMQTVLCDRTSWQVYLSNTGRLEWK